MKNPRVSVIMPVLNAAAYLPHAIESVVGQVFGDWELIVIDDGSTDDSAAIAQRYALLDDRIRILRPDAARRGAAAARNRGIEISRGEFIAFLDADDLYLPDKLARDIAALDADPEVAWAYGATRWFHQDGSRRDWTERLGVRVDRRYDQPDLLVRIIVEERGDVPCTCAVMIRRQSLVAVGSFDERLRLYEDQALWAKLFLHYPVRVMSGCHAAYRQHGTSTSTAATLSGDYAQAGAHPARMIFLEWLAEYARINAAPPAVIAAVDRASRTNQKGLLWRLERKWRRAGRYLHRR